MIFYNSYLVISSSINQSELDLDDHGALVIDREVVAVSKPKAAAEEKAPENEH